MILAAFAALLGEPVVVPEAPPVIAQAAPATVVLPAGTPVRLVTVGAIDSRSVKQGQRFALAIADDVMVGTRVVIPRGTPAVGEVEAVSAKGMFGQAAKLSLEPLFVDVGGERVNLAGTNNESGKDATTAAAIATVITPFGLMLTGKSVTVPVGAALPGQVRSDVTLTVR